MVIVAIGISAARRDAAPSTSAAPHGVRVGLFRPITLWPFPEAALREATKNARAVLVPELNIGQLRLEIERLLGRDKVEGLHHFSGEPITPGADRRARHRAGIGGLMFIDAADFDVRDYLRKEMMPHFLCPGCGHGIALRALLWALHDLDIDKDKLAVVSGIGCAGRLSAYIDANTFHTTHGRPLAYATGLALARPDLHVVVITGDGDCLAIGGNHLIHACRRNLKLTCLMLNNEIYGMTGGQVSPTTSETRLTTTTPLGNNEPNFDACALAAARRRELRRPRSDAARAEAEGTDQGRARSIRASPSSRCCPTAPRSSAARTTWARRRK